MSGKRRLSQSQADLKSTSKIDESQTTQRFILCACPNPPTDGVMEAVSQTSTCPPGERDGGWGHVSDPRF